MYAQVTQHFAGDDLVALTLAIITINAWNRIAIGFRAEPGTYQPAPATHPKVA